MTQLGIVSVQEDSIIISVSQIQRWTWFIFQEGSLTLESETENLWDY